MENIDLGLLIDLVKAHPYLYDKQTKNYKDIVMKDNAWKEIGQALNSTAEICLKAFLSIKEKYTRERKKFLAIASGSGSQTKSAWVWYDDMSFLASHIQQRGKATSNLTHGYATSSSASSCTNNSEVGFSDDEQTGHSVEHSYCVNDDPSQPELYTEEIPNPQHTPSKKSTPLKSVKRKKQDDIDKQILDTIALIGKKDECEEAEFGQLVAVELS